MANVQVENYTINTSNDQFQAIWQLTRAMKTAGWRYKASSDGTTKDASATPNPASDKWGGGVVVPGQTATVSFTIAAASGPAFANRWTITGLTGFVLTSSSTNGSAGHFLTITGATNAGNNGTWLITKVISATSVQIENFTGVAETTPGSATWTEVSALLDSYPAIGVGGWWNAQGPSTLRVPIGSSTPSGTFIRGENATQATTGATGEILGVLTDSGGNGFLVVAPRIAGTGAGVRGWSNSASITGDKSTATVSPTATIIEYVREVVFWRNTVNNGHIYFQVIDSVGEATTSATTGRFSTLAQLATATAVICPGGASGGNPTTNGFPTIGTYCVLGIGGAGAATTSSQNWMGNTSASSFGLGHGQILCANNIEDSQTSPDGTSNCLLGTPGNAPTSFVGMAFLRVDDQEDGDVDPYVWFMPATTAAYGRVRTNNPQTTTPGNADVFNTISLSTTVTYFIGWRCRGFPTADAFQEFQSGCLGSVNGSTPVLGNNLSSTDRVACSFTLIMTREPVWIGSTQLGSKMRKGAVRWWYGVQGGNGTDTYDGKRWMQVSSNFGPFVIGPADTVTIPTNA